MKNTIADTFLALLREKSFDKITVSDLSEPCGISRQAFYYHFQDIFEVVEWCARRKACQIPSGDGDCKAAVDALVRAVVGSAGVIQKLLNSREGKRFEKLMARLIREYLASMPGMPEDDAALKLYSYGILGLLLEHCACRKCDAGGLTKQICSFLKLD